MNFQFTKYSIVYYIVSGTLVLATFISLFVFGLKFGIEFTGGTTMEVEFIEEKPENQEIRSALSKFDLGEITVRPIGESGVALQFKGIDEDTHQEILNELNNLSTTEEKSFHYIGPSIGQELRNKTQLAIVLALFAITLYISFAFRKVSRPVSSWKYGVASSVALFHDILIPIGVFSILGRFYGVEITIPIIAALLTILGFSVHDTIVIFDRIRENIFRRGMGEFEDTVNWSLNQTIGRSLSTSFTTLIVLLSIFFFGGETLKYFSLALIIGMIAGSYSSIFLASPLLVSWYKVGLKRG
jgi:preprotein translocase subunit SecF